MKKPFLLLVIISIFVISACQYNNSDKAIEATNFPTPTRTDLQWSQNIQNINEVETEEKVIHISELDEGVWYDWENSNEFPINQSQCPYDREPRLLFMDNKMIWLDNHTLKYIDQENNNTVIDIDVLGKIFYINEKVIYSKSDGIYTAGIKGENQKKIINIEDTTYLEYFAYKEKIYVYNSFSKRLECYNIDGEKVGEYILPISIIGQEFYIDDSLYFHGFYLDDLEVYGDSWFIYRLDFITGEVEKCSPITAGNHAIVDETIYYTDFGLNKIYNGNKEVLLDTESPLGYEEYFSMYRNYILFNGRSGNGEGLALYAYDINENKLFELFDLGEHSIHITENRVFAITNHTLYELVFKENTVKLQFYFDLQKGTFNKN